MHTDALLERPADLTNEWLTAALGATVADFAYERIGTGQMSECYRVALTYSDGATGPATVILKVAAADPTSRQTGLAMGLYEHEVKFYTDIAPSLSGPVARCLHAAIDTTTGAFDLLLDDAAPARQGDEVGGASLAQAVLAVTELGRVHGPLLGDPSLAGADWLNTAAPVSQDLITMLYAGFVERYGESMTADQREVCERWVASFDAYRDEELASGRPTGLVHGDFRLDNLLFGEPGAARPLTIVDWQTVTWGPAMTDLAYFLGCALPTELRREHWDDLVAAYHEALGASSPLTLSDVREGVRRQSFMGVTMTIIASMIVERTERGDHMFLSMLDRNCTHVLDTDALAILPQPTTPEPLQPTVDDEADHPAGDEELWSESWYFDFVDPNQDIGGWIRLGLIPNQGHTWINALVCGPGVPTIAVLDWEAALPESHTSVVTDTVELALEATESLREYRVSLKGRGLAFDDPADLLREGDGRPVDVTMDLTWATVGTPYQYRISPRYEIPCEVSGTVTADGTTYRFSAVPGQRDHSWAARDWWSMEWTWTALHLNDGTHLHGVDIRIPGAPPVGVGYRQRSGEPLVELKSVTAEETFGADDLPISTELALDHGDLVASFEARGQAPVLLRAADGRLSRFPRAWGTVTTADGRTGVGWMEWNRNVTAPA